MSYTQVIVLQITLSVVIFTIIAKFYVWPRLEKLALPDALAPLLLLHAFRYLGLIFLVPSVVGTVPDEFAVPTAYGDLATGVLATAAVLALLYRKAAGIPLAWIVSVLGTVDFMYGYFQGLRLTVELGATFYIPVLFNPAMFVAQFMIFKLLISDRRMMSESREVRGGLTAPGSD